MSLTEFIRELEEGIYSLETFERIDKIAANSVQILNGEVLLFPNKSQLCFMIFLDGGLMVAYLAFMDKQGETDYALPKITRAEKNISKYLRESDEDFRDKLRNISRSMAPIFEAFLNANVSIPSIKRAV